MKKFLLNIMGIIEGDLLSFIIFPLMMLIMGYRKVWDPIQIKLGNREKVLEYYCNLEWTCKEALYAICTSGIWTYINSLGVVLFKLYHNVSFKRFSKYNELKEQEA